MSEDKNTINIGQIFDRNVMPQIDNPDDFRGYLQNNKIKSKKRLVDGSDLRSSQLNFDNEKIEAMMMNPTNKMMVVSNDGHVMDGHHRWIANQQMGRKCLVLQTELPILELIKTANDYNNQLNEEAGLHDHGELNHEKFGPMLDTFVQFASKKLGIKSLPSMRLEKEPMETSFGGYNPSEKSIVVISKNRHPMDIYRTVAHELVHHKQNEDGRLGKDIAKEGSTGSPIENEANAEAGKIMRWFAKSNPKMFKSGYVTESYLEEGLQDSGKFKVIFMGGPAGAGKNTISKRVLGGHGLTEIDSDVAFEHLMGKSGLNPMMPKEEDYERNLVRGRAKAITREKQRLALAGRRGIIVNTTASDPVQISQMKREFEKLGYRSKMLFVNVKDEVSKRRNMERGLRGGRKVPDGTNVDGVPDGSEDVRGAIWQATQNARPLLKNIFGKEHYIEVDNSADYNKLTPKKKKQIDQQHAQIRNHYRKFVAAPPNKPEAASWIEGEKKKRGISTYAPARATSMSQRQPKKYEPNASELEQAKVLGVSHIGGGQFGKTKDQPTHISRNGQLVMMEESLRDWFKSRSTDGKSGWVQVGGRYDGKPCARQPGQTSTPKCRSSSERASMSKKEKEYAFKKKQREDPDQPQKSGAAKPTMVKTYKHQKESYEMDKKTLQEKKDACYSKVKSRYKVWPSAYASGALVKCRKVGADNWGNKSKVDENFEEYISKSSNREEGTNSVAKIYKTMTPGQKSGKKRLAQEDNTIPRGGIGNPGSPGVGPETTVYRPMMASGYGGAGTIPMYESIEEWANNPITHQRFVAKYGDRAFTKLTEAVERLSKLELNDRGPKFFTHLREGWSYGKDPNDRMGTVPSQGKEEIGEEDEDVIKPSKSLKGYKKHIHPMSKYEKKSLGEQRTHTVSKGQTASGIASQYGMSLRQFRELNPSVRDINTIGVGQKFNVGAAPAATAPTTTAPTAARTPTSKVSVDFKAPSTPRQMPTDTGGDTGSKKVTDVGAQAFRGVGDTARGVIDRRLFNRTSDKEYDKLIKATHAETSPKGSSRENPGEHAGIALSIANRAVERGGGREGSITRVLNAPNQFQAVTGTKKRPGPSPEFRAGPTPERKKDIEDAIVRQGSSIPSNQVNFTAADPKAYKAGTDISWRTKLLKTGEVVGGSVFGTRRKSGAEPGTVANWTDPNSTPKTEPKKSETPKVDDKTLGFRPSQGFSSSARQTPEAPKTSGTVTADPNKDLGDQIRKWMEPQVDRMIRSRQTPEAPRAPSARAITPSSGGALSPEPTKKSQGSDATLGSQRTLQTPPAPLTKTQQAERDAEEKDKAENAATDQAGFRGNVNTGQRGMPLPKGFSDLLNDLRGTARPPRTQRDIDAETVRNAPRGSTTGSRYGDEGPSDPYGDLGAAKKSMQEESPAWQRKEGKNAEGGLNKKGVASYRAANPGSKLQTAVTTEPSKLKKGSKSAKRRLSFCRRMKGMKAKLTSAETARDPDSRINKSLRKWNCEE